MLTTPALSLLFVLNELPPSCSTLCLEIVFQPAVGLPQQSPSEKVFTREARRVPGKYMKMHSRLSR